ncbi:YbaN family protein [Lacrimispora sp. JR3]|uniref:YbaN family protein n=1 Tax=Lacrimispora sinapis TaxID=3111456 RepID=UPI0037493C64
MGKILLLVLGILSLALGTVGVGVPGLPTTPFFLLSLFCFTRSSNRLDRWFRGTKLFETYVKPFEEDKSLPRKQKLVIQLTAGTMMLFAFLFLDNRAIRLFLIVAFILHNYVFLFVIKTRKGEAPDTKTGKSNGKTYEL